MQDKAEVCHDINNAIQKYFRSSKRVRINGRQGVYVVVDDRKEAVELVERIFKSRDSQYEIVSAKNVKEAQEEINQRNEGADVKAVVIDLGLDGEGENGNGLHLAQWLEEEHSDIPYVISTGKADLRKQIEKLLPGVDVFVKGQNRIEDLAEALGLNIDRENEDESKIIPTDIAEENSKEERFINIFKNFFSF